MTNDNMNMDINATANNLTFVKSDVHIPRMVPLKTLAEESGFSYKALWLMCKQARFPFVKSGNKYYVNVDKFVEYLNTGDKEIDAVLNEVERIERSNNDEYIPRPKRKRGRPRKITVETDS